MKNVLHESGSRPLSAVYAPVSRTEPAALPALNPHRALERCLQPETRLALWRLHGVPVMPGAGSSTTDGDGTVEPRRYCVHLFQYRPLRVLRTSHSEPGVWLNRQVTRSEESDWCDVTDEPDDPEIRRVKLLAVRALYALGLDYGAVYVAVHHPARLRALDVDPDPDVPADLAEAYVAARVAYVRMWRKGQGSVLPVVLGADPEFALRQPDGRMGIASHYLEQGGVVGCDSARLRDDPTGRERPLVELRPQPAEDPRVLVRRLHRALEAAGRRIDPALEWIAGGMPFAGYPIGGHIHFSGIPLTFHLVRALDAYLCLPLFLLEDEGCRHRRPRYGFLGDVREQMHGGFEYRTLPSWLLSPELAAGVLALAKVVAASHWQLKEQPLAQVSVQRAYYRGEKASVRPLVRTMWQELRTLPLYHQYMRELDGFFTRIFAGGVWPAHEDIRPAWGIARARAAGAAKPFRNNAKQAAQSVL